MTSLRREIRVPIYWLVVGMAVMLVSPILAVAASVHIAENRAERARAESAQRSCALFSALLDTYDETPPLTPAGRNVRATYLEFYTRNGCEPPRK